MNASRKLKQSQNLMSGSDVLVKSQVHLDVRPGAGRTAPLLQVFCGGGVETSRGGRRGAVLLRSPSRRVHPRKTTENGGTVGIPKAFGRIGQRGRVAPVLRVSILGGLVSGSGGGRPVLDAVYDTREPGACEPDEVALH